MAEIEARLQELTSVPDEVLELVAEAAAVPEAIVEEAAAETGAGSAC